MANKYENRRRALKESAASRANPFASPRTQSRIAPEARPQPSTTNGRRAGRGVVIAICCMLAVGSAIVFGQTARHKFVNCDDNEYIYDNADIQRGLTPASAWWAITQPHSANWHPLTWMSHMIDWQVFGRWDADRQRYVDSWPGGHHAVNVILHSICAVLLFLVLQAMTGGTWPSALVAALFAIHPLRTESVAWVTERKDLLSGLFFMLTLAAYQAYATRPFSWWRYGLVFAGLALGLMAKSMLVTVPFVLLLLDFWPLRRIVPPRSGDYAPPWLTPRVILEKLPLLALSVASCFLTVWAQTRVDALKQLELRYRIGNALVSYAAYIGQMFYPADMIVQYVHPGPNLLLEQTFVPAAVLMAITLAVGWLGWRRPYLAVGWFIFLGMLVPVIGLVQVGAQARADRYTYLPQIGLYIMLAWGLADLARMWRGLPALYAALSVPVLAALAMVAWLQTTYWQNSVTLWQHCVACQPNNDFAQNEYGQALTDVGRADEAMDHYLTAVTVNPKYISPRTNLAVYLQQKHKFAEALQVCEDALKVSPDDAQAHFLKAVVLFSLNKPEQSISEFHVTLELNPHHLNAHNDLAEVYRMTGRYDEAFAECQAALDINPDMPEARRTMGNLWLAKNELDKAASELQTAVKLKPTDPLAHQGLAEVLWRQGKFAAALQQRKEQLALDPQNLTGALQVARGLLTDPRPEARFGAEALAIARRVNEASGNQDITSLEVLAAAYAEVGDFDQAEATIRTAMETPLGKKENNASVLQQRLRLYHAHQHFILPPPS
jgi:protein O-mannosyl-transferase